MSAPSTGRGPPTVLGGGHHIVVSPGDELHPVQGGPWDRFVTARWGAFHRRGPLPLYTPVEHRPWPLRAAQVLVCSVDAVFRDAGLPAPPVHPLRTSRRGAGEDRPSPAGGSGDGGG